MSIQYNILPLALGTDYYVLARAGVLIPPLRERGDVPLKIYSGRILSRFQLNAAYKLIPRVTIDAGRIKSKFIVECDGYDIFDQHIGEDVEKFSFIFRLKGHYGLIYNIGKVPLSFRIKGNFDTHESISLDIGKFTTVFDLKTPTRFFVCETGKFPLSFRLRCENWQRQFTYIPPPISKISFRCLLTGDQNGLDDLIIPINSFQAKLRSGTASFCEVVIPGVMNYTDGISLRPDGDIVIEMVTAVHGHETSYNEIVKVPFHDLGFDLGARRKTGRISGYRTRTNQAPKTVEITNVSSLSLQKNGLRRVRCDINFYTRPGDTITWGNDSMIAGVVAISVGTHTRQMDITETDA